MSPHLVRALGHLPSPSRRRCWGWRPRESHLRPESSQVLRPPHILSGNLTPPLEFRKQCTSKGTWAGLTSPCIPETPGPAPPFWGCPQPLTISTAIGNIAGGGLDPGHDLCQVGEPGAGEGQHVCAAALDKVSRSPVREHLFNDIAPAPAPKQGLPVLVAHILQKARGWGHPCQLFSSTSCPSAYSHFACPFPGPSKASHSKGAGI